MAKKSSKKVLCTWKEYTSRALSVTAALLGIIILIPVLPWRKAGRNPVFHTRFVEPRSVTLFSMTDSMYQYKPFNTYKFEMCTLAKTFLSPDVGYMIGSEVFKSAKAKSGVAEGIQPAVLLGCRGWMLCKNHVSVRCSGYWTLAIVGWVTLVFVLVSVALTIAVPVLQSNDLHMKAGGKKQKKKKEAAKLTTMLTAIAAPVFSSIGLMVYVFATDGAFKGFQSGAFYPYPAADAGVYMCLVMVILHFANLVVSVLRVYPMGGKKSGDDSDDDAPAAEPSAGLGFASSGPAGFPLLASGPPMIGAQRM